MKFYDNYKLQSGWLHNYYCDNDGAELIFDINNNTYYECPLCNKKYIDAKRKMAWITKYRYEIFSKLEKYSKEYLFNKDEKYLNYIIQAFKYYANNYKKFPIHNKEGEIFNTYKSNRCGRITAQGLNEAMIMIKAVNCIDNIEEFLSKQTKNNIIKKLFPQVFELLKPQIRKIHNIDCYEICAIGMMGILSNNKNMIDFALNSEYSFYNQLKLGITKDNFWFEGSFHYHLFILKPILEFLKIAKKYKINICEEAYNKAKDMLTNVYKFSFSDCSLPSPNDGWPNRHLKDYIEVFELGNEVFNNEFNDIIEKINRNTNNSNTMHLLDTGFSILKSQQCDIFIKYKENNISHSHPDKLGIEIKIGDNFLTHDLSTTGYGSNISKEFYKKTYAHNTIVIDGTNQNIESESKVIQYNDNSIKVEVDDAYYNCKMCREIATTSSNIYDKLLVECKENKKIDYFFHCDAILTSKIKYNNVKDIEEYPYLNNIKKINSDTDNIILEWKLVNNNVISEIDIKDKELYICSSPDNPKNKERTTLLIRNKNENEEIRFEVKWTII